MTLSTLCSCSNIQLRSPATINNVSKNSCEKVNHSLVKKLSFFSSIKNPWPSINQDRMFIGLYDKSNLLYITGKKAKEVKSKLSASSLCDTASNEVIVYIDSSKEFEGLFGLSEISHPLFSYIDREMLFVAPLINKNIGQKRKTLGLEAEVEDIMIDVAIHEQFHFHSVGVAGVQEISKKKVESGLFSDFRVEVDSSFSITYDQCYDEQSPFMLALQDEFNDWRSVNYAQTPIKSAEEFARKILSRRNTTAGKYIYCWDALREKERSEGTATYFANHHSYFNESEKLNPIDTFNEATFNSSNTSFYYLTGLFLSRLADMIDPSKDWQLLVKKGLSIDEAISRILMRKEGKIAKKLSFSIAIEYPDDKEYSSNIAEQIFSEANKCIKESLAFFEDKLEINLELESVSSIKRSDMSSMALGHFALDKDTLGSTVLFYTNTFNSQNINLNFGPFGNRPHYLPTEKFISLVNSRSLSHTRELEKHEKSLSMLEGAEHEQYRNNKKIEDLEDASQEEVARIFEELHKASSLNSIFPLANELRLNESFLDSNSNDDLKEAGITFAHELMHTIGDLKDQYYDPKTEGVSNLMGSYHGGNKCIFNKSQVERIRKLRFHQLK